MTYQFLSIDLQNDFTAEGGKAYKPRPSVNFDKEVLFPFLKENGIKIGEIISDYRPPRPGDRGECCFPNTWGYESIVPIELVKAQWIKCMNSPIWVRENIGNPSGKAGLPYQDTKAFGEWLDKNIGKPEEVIPVLFGLTIDCCVLSTLQELSWRGYYPVILKEAVDHYDGTEESKASIFKTPVSNWGNVIDWEELRNEIIRSNS